MKPWLKISLSLSFTILVIVLIVLFDKYQRETIVPEPKISIKTTKSNAFLDRHEVLKRLQFSNLLIEGQTFEELDTDSITRFLKSISQIKDVKVYRRFGSAWNIDIVLREPIARIYNQSGQSFYLDADGVRMLTTPKFTAQVVVVNGRINEQPSGFSVNEIINNDSLKSIHKLDDIYRISKYVCDDPLLHALIGQIYLKDNGDFLLVPLVGEQRIVFGSAYSEKEVSDKFEKLKIFYNEAMDVEGWNTYSEINLKYRDQIVCKKKDQ